MSCNSTSYGVHMLYIHFLWVYSRFRLKLPSYLHKLSVWWSFKKGITGWAVTWHSANHLTTHVTPAACTCLCFSHGRFSLCSVLPLVSTPTSYSSSSFWPLTRFIHPRNCTLPPSCDQKPSYWFCPEQVCNHQTSDTYDYFHERI